MTERSLFDELGGEPALRRIIERFVDRVFDDVMIGYLFRNADRARVKEKEFEHAAAHLGGPVAYTGRPLASAHAPHRIRGGQFMRRVQILKETLAELGAPPAVAEHWLAETLRLRPLITSEEGDVCDPSPARGALETRGVEK
ncbi:MAG TPA: group 1 truncated hemoglobin [Polyangiaceae bacterium]|nr:group 1 truncated hemoglobin [Polyangiaceae bacterium]